MTTESLVLAAGVWGALTGVLLPRAAYRFSVPPGEPWRDRCPAGAHPVRGWLGGAGCGACRGEPGGGLRGPGGENLPTAVLATVTALVCAALAVTTGTRPELGVWLLLAPVGVLLATVDLRVRRLPDPLTLPLAVAALALLGVTALLPGHTGDWPTALYAALALAAGHFVLHLVNPDGMGFGDVKLAAGTGAALGWYGWPAVLLGTFAAFLLGALYGGALVLARRAGRKTGVPFGPFLLAGTLAGLLTGAFAA
ncbi:prepilin peptidase [Streptomyces sp. WELS2]|uniref:prepilin peptidase n=1 Tax=Streptomyces sp. WELS2 TaxID=2749435 RepID=UPI0015F071A4|nr:prepilin peptidase [Streptomyces sp. WELS2]